MKLHENKELFKELISLTAKWRNIPQQAVERDYYIVMLLENLAKSEYADKCVFKGGTSLSKCYPGSIERFSEDIDLTFLGLDYSDNACDKEIKKIESIISSGAQTQKIESERSKRSKSMFVWYENYENKIKLEIGSTVRPDPYSKKTFKSYIHEFLEENNGVEDIEKYVLKPITLNVLNIERTFIDKLLSIKRHTICGTIINKVRHIYDVKMLYQMAEIKDFLKNTSAVKELVELTKKTDYYYLSKRSIDVKYDPNDKYNFEEWKDLLENVKGIYEKLHIELLYTSNVQSFDDAVDALSDINKILNSIGE